MKAFLYRPQTVWLRRALLQVHLWIGVLVGLYIVVVSVTGAALVFRIDMQRALHANLFTPKSTGAVMDAATVLDTLQRAYPGERVAGIDAPTTSRPTYLAYVGSGKRFATVLLDPVSGQILGELPTRSFVKTLQDLHFDLFAGRTGRVVNGVGALCLLGLCMTGLVIWWPGVGSWRRAFSVDIRRGWRRVNWDLHSAAGIWTVLLIGMWSVTGAYFAFPSQFRATVNALSPVTVNRPPRSAALPADLTTPPTWREHIQRARLAAPNQFVARVVIPSTDTAAFLVMFSPVRPTPAGTTELTSVYLDQFTGARLTALRAPRTAGDVVMAWVGPLHVGSFGGVWVKVAWLGLALSPPLLFVTGFIMWWLRVVRGRWLKRRGARGATRVSGALIS